MQHQKGGETPRRKCLCAFLVLCRASSSCPGASRLDSASASSCVGRYACPRRVRRPHPVESETGRNMRWKCCDECENLEVFLAGRCGVLGDGAPPQAVQRRKWPLSRI